MGFNEFSQKIESSLVKNCAELHLSVSAANSIAGSGTYYKVNGTTVPDEETGFSASGNNRFVCNDETSKKYLIIVNLSAFVSSANVIASFSVNKNGNVETNHVSRTIIGASSAPQTSSFQMILSLVKDDYIEVVLSNNTNTNSITVSNMTLTVIEI